MADKRVEDVLTELERMEVEERRRKALEDSFRHYMESPAGQKVKGSSMDRGFEILKEDTKKRKKRKTPILPYLNKEESLLGTKF
jgi:hypothetical protein